MTESKPHRIFSMAFASVYPLYVAKVAKKGRSQAELDAVLCWLTGFDQAELQRHVAERTTFADLFAAAKMPEATARITGVVCGVRVEQVEDPLMQKIRYMDKVVDELAKGWPVPKVLRQ